MKGNLYFVFWFTLEAYESSDTFKARPPKCEH